VTYTKVTTTYHIDFKLRAPYTKSQFNDCMKAKFRNAVSKCITHEVGSIQIQSVNDVNVRRSLPGSAGTPNVQQNAFSTPPPPPHPSELRAAAIEVSVNITNVRDEVHYASMRKLITNQKINAAMVAEGLLECNIIQEATLATEKKIELLNKTTSSDTKKLGGMSCRVGWDRGLFGVLVAGCIFLVF
jgi:hypothetical protein